MHSVHTLQGDRINNVNLLVIDTGQCGKCFDRENVYGLVVVWQRIGLCVNTKDLSLVCSF